MSNCKKCLLPIQWRQNTKDKWIPMELKGDRCHWEVCRGEPIKGTKVDLQLQIADLEVQLKEVREQLSNYQFGYQRQLEMLKEERLNRHTQQVIDHAVAWFRARKKRQGKTSYRFNMLKQAIDYYCEIENK